MPQIAHLFEFKSNLRQSYQCRGTTNDDPEVVFVDWFNRLYVAVNYSSTDCTTGIPGTAKILVGEKTVKPVEVCGWSE
jgi:beta-galactosidase